MEQYGQAVEHCLRRLETAARDVEHKKYNAWKRVTEKVYAALREQEQRLVDYGDSEEQRILLEGERRVARIRQGIIGMYSVDEDEVEQLQRPSSPSPTAPSATSSTATTSSTTSSTTAASSSPTGASGAQTAPAIDDMYPQRERQAEDEEPAAPQKSTVSSSRNRFDDVERDANGLEIITLGDSELVDTLDFDDEEDSSLFDSRLDPDSDQASVNAALDVDEDNGTDTDVDTVCASEPTAVAAATSAIAGSTPEPTGTTRVKRKVISQEPVKKKTAKRPRTSHRLELKRRSAERMQEHTTSSQTSATQPAAEPQTAAEAPRAAVPPSHSQVHAKPKFRHPQEFPHTSRSTHSGTSNGRSQLNNRPTSNQTSSNRPTSGRRRNDDDEGDDEGDDALRAPARWMWNCSNLRAYKKNTGHSSPTYRFSSRKFPRLGRWVNKQRHNRESLNSYQLAQLNALGFNWTPGSAQTRSWDECCDDLQAYTAEHGTADVPDGFSTKKYPSLGNWLRIQKEGWRNELTRLDGGNPRSTRRLTIDRRHRLLQLGVTP